jgi:hypothetical protein
VAGALGSPRQASLQEPLTSFATQYGVAISMTSADAVAMAAITSASGGFLGWVCAASNGRRSVRHGRADDHRGGKCRTEPVGTLGLWCPPPRPPPPDPSSEAKQSQTADDQLKRWRHLPGGLHEEVDGRLCADRRRGGEDQEQRQEEARAPHVATKAQRKGQMLPEIRLTRHSEKPRTSPTHGPRKVYTSLRAGHR